MAAFVVLILSNVAIVGFIGLAEQRAQSGTATASANAAQLAKFYGELGGFFYAPLPKGMSDPDYDEWQHKMDMEIDKITGWMRENMSPAAEYRFGNFNLKQVIKFSAAVNDKHNREKNMILLLQENLHEMMASTAWDKPK